MNLRSMRLLAFARGNVKKLNVTNGFDGPCVDTTLTRVFFSDLSNHSRAVSSAEYIAEKKKKKVRENEGAMEARDDVTRKIGM